MCDHAAQPLPALTPMHARSFPGSRAHIRDARQFIAIVLRDCPATEDAVLLASELAANAVSHSASSQPGGTFTVRAQLRPDHLYAEVEDQGSTWNGDIHSVTPPHGLFLLRELADGYGTHRGQHGWITWFTIAQPPPAGHTP